MTTQVFGLDIDRRTIGIAVGVLGVVAAAVLGFQITGPKITEVQSLEGQIATANSTLATQQQQKQQLAEVPTKLVRANQTFDNLVALLPKEEAQSILLIDVARIVQGSQAQLVQFSPGVLEPSTEVQGLNNLAKATSKVSITGTFPQTLKVLRDIERLEQLLKVEELAVTPKTADAKDPKTLGTLSMAFNLTAYSLPPGAVIKPVEAKPAEGAKKDEKPADSLSENPALQPKTPAPAQ